MRIDDEYRRLIRESSEDGLGPAARCLRLTAIIRSLLQTMYLVGLEVAAKVCDESTLKKKAGSWLERDTATSSRLIFKSDAEPIERIPGLLKLVQTEHRDWARGLAELLRGDVSEWRKRRNDLAHGVPYELELTEWATKDGRLARSLLQTGADLLPLFEDGRPHVMLKGVHVSLPCLPVEHAHSYPFVVRDAAVGRQRCRLRLWRLAGFETAERREYEVKSESPWAYLQPDDRHGARVEYIVGEPTVLRLPELGREFFGRENDLKTVVDWWDHDRGGTALLVQGLGGMGKTALIEEFLRRFKDGKQSERYRPTHVCFTTAKKTWFQQAPGEGAPRDEQPAVVLEILAGCLDPTWKPGRRAAHEEIEKAIDDLGVDPARVVLIVDNAETLESEAKPRLFKALSDLGIRVVVTSRNQEPDLGVQKIISLGGLDEEAAIDLVEARVKKKSRSVDGAHVSGLKQAVNTLERSPLLLQVFGDRWNGHEDPTPLLEELKRKAKPKLLEFLYADRWDELDRNYRDVLLAISDSDGTLDTLSIIADKARRPVDVLRGELLDDERFGAVREYGRDWEFVLDDHAARFLEEKRKQGSRWKKLQIAGGTPSRRMLALRRWRAGDRDAAWEAIGDAFEASPADVVVARTIVEMAVEQRSWAGSQDKLIQKAAATVRQSNKDSKSLLLLARWVALYRGGLEGHSACDNAEEAGAPVMETALARGDASLRALTKEDWRKRLDEADRFGENDAEDEVLAERDGLVRSLSESLGKAEHRREELRKASAAAARRRVARADLWAAQVERGLERAQVRFELSEHG